MITPPRPAPCASSLRPPAALVVLCVVAAHLVPATRGREDDDDREYRRKTSQTMVRENCLFCHSEEMIASQRLTAKQWKAEVEKMVGWGAPLAEEQRQLVVDFLADEYPADAPDVRPANLTLADALDLVRPDPGPPRTPGDPDRGAPIYARNCANCHGADGQGAELGPNLVEKPVLLRSADYADVVRNGRGRMPGLTATVDRSAEADILAWLKTRKFRARDPGLK